MEMNRKVTTSANSVRLRLASSVNSGMPGPSRDGNHGFPVGGNVLSCGIAGTGEQGNGGRVSATEGDV